MHSSVESRRRSPLLDASWTPRGAGAALRRSRGLYSTPVRLSVLANACLALLLLFSRRRSDDSAVLTEVARAHASLAATGQQLSVAQEALLRARDALTSGPARGLCDDDSPSPLANSSALKWLVIGITTVPRPQGASYLSATLRSLLDELPDGAEDPLGPSAVEVLVMNMEPGAHAAFNEAREGVGRSRKGRLYLRFLDRPSPCDDPTPDAPPVDDLDNPKNIPGKEVRRQTCDVATLLETAAPRAGLYMFMEDDFEVCGHFISALHYALAKATLRVPDWLALRVSYGMNGIVMRQADLLPFAAFLRRHVTRLPPDLLWQEWASSGGSRGGQEPGSRRRPLMVFRQNLLAHTGDVSSFAVRPHRRAWPGCFAPLENVWSLAKAERFDGIRCSDEDLSPCSALAESDRDWATRLPLFGVEDPAV